MRIACAVAGVLDPFNLWQREIDKAQEFVDVSTSKPRMLYHVCLRLMIFDDRTGIPRHSSEVRPLSAESPAIEPKHGGRIWPKLKNSEEVQQKYPQAPRDYQGIQNQEI